MSMIETTMPELRMDDDLKRPRAMAGYLPHIGSPLVPKRSTAGRALVAVIAIMTFLASLTTGAVMLVRSAAIEWQSDVSREVTVQLRPVSGRNIDVDVESAVEVVRKFPGVREVRPFSKAESAHLLEPWLGSGLAIDELPVPRIIVVKLAPGSPVDLATLTQRLSERVPGATLDDHRAWAGRMRTMAQTVIIGGIVILVLMLAATILSVTFATRGAMAANRPIIEVLHFVGAKTDFIASQFQRQFLIFGLEGGLIGGGLAMLLFGLANIVATVSGGTAGADQLAVLFGSFALGPGGYLAIFGQIVLIAAVTAVASRWTVGRTLETVE